MLTDKELAELDLAVARAEGIKVWADRVHDDTGVLGDPGWTDDIPMYRMPNDNADTMGPYQPTRDGAEAMRLLEKHGFTVGRRENGEWLAFIELLRWLGAGPTPAIAICRAVVALSGTPQGKDTQGRRGKV